MRAVVRDSALARPEGLPLTWFLVVGGVVGLPLLVLVPDYSYRYGLQWLSFYFACGGCSALVFAQRDLRRDYLRFLRHRFPSEVIAILLMMIFGSVVANGFMPQATGVLTMLMVLGTWPLLSFLWFIQYERHDHLYLLVQIVLGVVLAESCFLSFYQWFGLGMSSLGSLSNWPRVFLNVRDNNQWLACGFWIPIGLWFSAKAPKSLSILLPRLDALLVIGFMAMFWYLDLLTYGRGAFLAMVLCTACAAFWCYRSLDGKVTLWFLRDQLIGFCLAVMGVVALRSSLPFSNMASRIAVDVGRSESGRWQILLHWIDGWLNSSVLWGQGWGVIPPNVGWAPWSKDPHNIYVQILCDGGIWAAVLTSLVVILVLRSVMSKLCELPVMAFGAGLLIYQGVDRIWAIPSGLIVIIVSAALLLDFKVIKNGPDGWARLISRLSSWLACVNSAFALALCMFLLYISDGRP